MSRIRKIEIDNFRGIQKLTWCPAPGTLADEVMVGDALSFDGLLRTCADLEAKVNEVMSALK
jgi:hypothetical protein